MLAPNKLSKPSEFAKEGKGDTQNDVIEQNTFKEQFDDLFKR